MYTSVEHTLKHHSCKQKNEYKVSIYKYEGKTNNYAQYVTKSNEYLIFGVLYTRYNIWDQKKWSSFAVSNTWLLKALLNKNSYKRNSSKTRIE